MMIPDLRSPNTVRVPTPIISFNLNNHMSSCCRVHVLHKLPPVVSTGSYVHKEGSDNPQDFRLQEPGEEGGQLYNLWMLPMKQLGDFGLGVGCVVARQRLTVVELWRVHSIVVYQDTGEISATDARNAVVRGTGHRRRPTYKAIRP